MHFVKSYCSFSVLRNFSPRSLREILRGMTWVLLLVIAGFPGLSQTSTPVEGCNEQAIVQKKGSWKKRGDALMHPGNQSAVHSRIDQISKLFMTAYPSPMGLEPAWYRTMTSPMFTNGPTGYAYNSLYFAWYCNKNYNKMMLGGETGTWAYVFVNYFSWFLYDTLSFRVAGQRVYRLPEPMGEWNGYPLYDAPAHSGNGRCIVLHRNGMMPWKKITQQQYLEGLRKIWMKRHDEAAAAGGKTMESYQRSIASLRNNPVIKPPDKEKTIAGIQKNMDEFQKRRAADSIKTTGYWKDKIAVIDRYLTATPVATRQQPARMLRKETNDFQGSFGSGPHSSEFVTVNTSYFNLQLPKYVPQLMVLYWRWSDNTPSHDFRGQFESRFPIEQLQAMIDK